MTWKQRSVQQFLTNQKPALNDSSQSQATNEENETDTLCMMQRWKWEFRKSSRAMANDNIDIGDM